MSAVSSGWLAQLLVDGETADTERDARLVLRALFPEVPDDAPLEPDDAGAGLWLVTLPIEVADAARAGVGYADTMVLESYDEDGDPDETIVSAVVDPTWSRS